LAEYLRGQAFFPYFNCKVHGILKGAGFLLAATPKTQSDLGGFVTLGFNKKFLNSKKRKIEQELKDIKFEFYNFIKKLISFFFLIFFKYFSHFFGIF
jgi:hypothetical protein